MVNTQPKSILLHLALLLSQCIYLTSAQNESFPWYSELREFPKYASIVDQYVYTSAGQVEPRTYYSITIKQDASQANMRVALQWLRDVENLRSEQYRGVVLQISTSSSNNNPSINVQDAADYNIYKEQGGVLNFTDYLDAVLRGGSGFVGGSGGNQLQNLRGQVIRTGNEVEVQINFTIPQLDPIGESRVWYRWSFYNTIGQINTFSIKGNSEPYFYSTYMRIGDFFDTDRFLNYFYIMFATSLFWWFGLPFTWGFGLYMEIIYILQSFQAARVFRQWPGSDEYTLQLWTGLLLGFTEMFIAVEIVSFMTMIPFISPWVNAMVVLYMYISYLWQDDTSDKRLYYGKKSQYWQDIPQIIDHDAFFDIHWRGLNPPNVI